MAFPYDITKYEIDVICSHISYRTGTPFHLVKQKKQISYLDGYLLAHDKPVTTIIIENNYIERNFTENYSEYYSRCFFPYSKTCSRIHFFSFDRCESNYTFCKKWKDEDFEELLNNADKSLLTSDKYKNFQDNYLGFVVISPIPQTFLAKICLKPYERLTSVLVRNYHVSLFGIPLKVKTVAFQEQDKVLSACATTALWSFTHAYNNQRENDIPSPVVITKMAKPNHQGHDRQFPNTGLSSYMIRLFINETGLEPEELNLLDKESNVADSIKEYCYTFINSGKPLICGVSVYEETEKTDEYRLLGDHAITILGFSLNKANNESDDLNLVAHTIDKLYVHDDRIGPFARLILKNLPINIENKTCENYFVVEIDKSVSTEITKFSKQILVPNIFIWGLYHKIRIKYSAIKCTASAFNRFFNKFLDSADYKGYLKDKESYVDTSLWKWEISLLEVNEFKEKIISSSLKSKISYLTKHWPKYIWVVKVDKCEGNTTIPLFTLCFDATDIPLGKLFLDLLIFNEETRFLFSALSLYCDASVSSSSLGDKANIDENLYLWGVIYHLANINKLSYLTILDERYGAVRMPRYFKDTEIKKDSLYFSDGNRFEIFEETDVVLNVEKDYLWLINEEGNLIIGEETFIETFAQTA